LNDKQLNAKASEPGTYVYTPKDGYRPVKYILLKLHVDFTSTDTADYNTESDNVEINISYPILR